MLEVVDPAVGDGRCRRARTPWAGSARSGGLVDVLAGGRRADRVGDLVAASRRACCPCRGWTWPSSPSTRPAGRCRSSVQAYAAEAADVNTNALTATTTTDHGDDDDRGAEALAGATARRSGGAASRGGRRGACPVGLVDGLALRPRRCRPVGAPGGDASFGFGQGRCSTCCSGDRRRVDRRRAPAVAARALARRVASPPDARRRPGRGSAALSRAQGSFSQSRTSGRVSPKNSRPARTATTIARQRLGGEQQRAGSPARSGSPGRARGPARPACAGGRASS